MFFQCQQLWHLLLRQLLPASVQGPLERLCYSVENWEHPTRATPPPATTPSPATHLEGNAAHRQVAAVLQQREVLGHQGGRVHHALRGLRVVAQLRMLSTVEWVGLLL